MPSTIAQILKAAASLSSFTVEQIARETGIDDSRVARILRGTTPPKGDEAARILIATGCDPDLTEQAGSDRRLSDLLRLIASREQKPLEAVPLAACDLAIDRLAFTFNASDRAKLEAKLARCKPVAGSALYKSAYHYRGIRVHHSPLPANKSSRSSRIEFTPSKVLDGADPAAEEFLGLLGPLIKPSEAVISRLDVAVDAPVSIRDVQAVAEGPKKVGQWFGQDGVQTLYYGTKNNPYQATVYDKRREYRERARPEGNLDSPLTRFEVRTWRPGLALPALSGFSNPFQRLRLVELRATSLAFDRELLVEAARFYGLAALKGQLEAAKFNELLRDLEVSAAALLVPHPREVYAEKWPSSARALLAALRLGGTP